MFTRLALEAAAEGINEGRRRDLARRAREVWEQDPEVGALRRSIEPPTIRPIQVRFSDGSIAGEVVGASYQELPGIRPVDPPEDPYTWDSPDIEFKIRYEFALAGAVRSPLATLGIPVRLSMDLDPDAWYLFAPPRSHAAQAEDWIVDFRLWPSWGAFWQAVKHAFLSGVEDA